MPYAAHDDFSLSAPQEDDLDGVVDLSDDEVAPMGPGPLLGRPHLISIVSNVAASLDSDNEPDREQLLAKGEDILAPAQAKTFSYLEDVNIPSSQLPWQEVAKEVAESPRPVLSPRSSMLYELRQSRSEEERLRKAYEVELARGAELRTQLELAENYGSATAMKSLEEELSEASAELDKLKVTVSRESLCAEEELAFCQGILESQAREIGEFQKQAQADKEECHRLKTVGPISDSAVEEELRNADLESSELLADVQRREQAIMKLDQDLQNVLEYMVTVNITAAGGPSRHLGPSDFLPDGVRRHLGLGKYGEDHLERICRRHQLQMQQLPGESLPEEKLSHSMRPSEAVDEVKREPKIHAEGLVAAELEVDGDFDTSAVWLDPQGESTPKAEEAELQTALALGKLRCIGTQPTTSIEEEGKQLRESLATELQRLTDAMARCSMALSPGLRPLFDLLVAVAKGDVEMVKAMLPKQEVHSLARRRGGADDEEAVAQLGWTPWHLAAVHGHKELLDCMKEDMVLRGAHHRAILGQSTAGTGLPPFAVACLAGHVEAAKALLQGMAPIDARDARGNTPLLWAQMGGHEKELVPLLLAAQADPEVCNCSGQRVNVNSLSQAPLSLNAAPVESVEGSERPRGDASPAYTRIKTSALKKEDEPGFLSYTLGILKTPVRDRLAFAKKSVARKQAQLSGDEEAAGVWSEWVVNFTHAGLSAAVSAEGTHTDPANFLRNKQAFVLTCERILLFNARSWSLEQVIALSELSELCYSSHGQTVLILRMHRNPDIVLDVEQCSRSRLLEELKLATETVNAKWGGSDFGSGLRILQECEPLSELLDENRKKIGVLAWVEANVFLLLPYTPSSVLLSEHCFFFGQLDLHQKVKEGNWDWRTYFFMLNSGRGDARQLLWCRRPNDELCAGSVQVRNITAVQALDTPGGEVCLIVEYRSAGKDELLTLRANSVQSREDWIVSIRTMQVGA